MLTAYLWLQAVLWAIPALAMIWLLVDDGEKRREYVIALLIFGTMTACPIFLIFR